MPSTHTLKTLAIAALSALAATGAANAAAASNHVDFGYKSSELQTATGVETLYRRIENKAENACHSKDARALYAKLLAAQCESALVEDWVENIGDARLRQTHAQAKSTRNFASLN